MKNLIVIIGKNKYQFDTKEELLQSLLGDSSSEYSNLTAQEKKDRRYLKAYINMLGKEDKILDYKRESNGQGEIDISEKFLIDNDDMYVMSLLRANKIILLEHKEANIFAKNIQPSNAQDNYIIINSYALDIVKSYIEDIKKQQNNKDVDR